MRRPCKFVLVLVVALIFLAIAASPDSAEGSLRAHWKLDETSGITAVDSTGNGNDATLVGSPAWTAAKIDGGLRLNGSTQTAVVPSAALGIDSWSQLTISAWVKNDIGAGAGTDDIVSWWRWTGYPCSDCSFALTHHWNNQYFFEIRGSIVSGGSVGTGWSFVAATYDGSAMRLYVDGALVGSTPYSGGIPWSSADLVLAGQADGSNYFDGILDDVRILDHALTAGEVLDLFNAGTVPPDSTPPSRPEGLSPQVIGYTSIGLSWAASIDGESGVSYYKVYRDEGFVGQSETTAFSDSNLNLDTEYRYEVSAVNGQGMESERSLPLDVSTLADGTAPSIVYVQATETDVVVAFDEPLDPAAATDVSNYSIDNGISISTAYLDAPTDMVVLATSPHVEGVEYTLTVSGVQDTSGNAMLPEAVTYSAVLTDPTLEAHWRLDEDSGNSAADATGNGHTGTLLGGPSWGAGLVDGGLRFDGNNDHVVVPAAPLDMDTWDEISVGGWIKNDVGLGSGTDDIVSQWNFPSSRSWVLTHHSNGRYFWEIAGKGFVTGGSVSTDWTHVMGTYGGGTIRLYVDGVEVASQGGVSGLLPGSSADLVIGGQDDGSNFFDGTIDEVQIFGRALSPAEVAEIVADSDPDPTNLPPRVTAGASPESGTEPLLVQLSADANDDDGFVASYFWSFGDGDTSSDPNPVHLYVSAGTYNAEVTVTDDDGATATGSVSIEVTPLSTGPTDIDVWYDLEQSFGHLGLPQTWVNILGSVSDPDGIAALSYSLNGGSPSALSIGPDDRRLSRAGDINIEIGIDDLEVGTNSVEIWAQDSLGEVSTETVMVEFDDSKFWPLPYTVDWSTVSSVQDAVQVVDGLWALTPDGLRIIEDGYDRVLAIGDLGWTDYEITVPIKVHDYFTGDLPWESGSPGFGLTMRWRGHTDDPAVCPQPHCGWLPSGAGAWYDIGYDGPLTLDDVNDHSVKIYPGDTFIWKLRVETVEPNGSLYSLKVWREGDPEPESWNLQSQRDSSDLESGSVLINAHHVDMTIGDILLVPSGTTTSDTDPPQIESVTALDDSTVVVSFSEPVDGTSATDLGNYSIDSGIQILGAIVQGGGQMVSLATTPHVADLGYSLTVSGILDLATPPNGMSLTTVQYAYSEYQPALQFLFEEGSGPQAIDSSGNGFDGLLMNGASWMTDPVRGAVIEMDGGDDLVGVDSQPIGMDTWDRLTIAAWVKNDVGSGAGTDDIVSWWKWTGYPCTDCSFVLTHHWNDQYFFELGGTTVSGGTVGTDWTYVVATYDSSTIRLYVDAVLVDSAAYSGGIPFSSAAVFVGGQADFSNYFDGRLDNVEIFDVDLSPAEILEKYQNN